MSLFAQISFIRNVIYSSPLTPIITFHRPVDALIIQIKRNLHVVPDIHRKILTLIHHKIIISVGTQRVSFGNT